MGYNSEVTSFQFRQRKDTSHRRQFLPRETAHNTRLTEQSLHRRVTAGNGSCMTGCRPAATLRGSSLNSGNLTTFSYQRTGMEQQFVGIRDILNVQQFN